MYSSDDDISYGDKPIVSEINTSDISTEVGNFSLSPFPIKKSESEIEGDDPSSNLLLNRELAEISLYDSSSETKTINEAENTPIESIDNQGQFSGIQLDIDSLVTLHTFQYENLEVVTDSPLSNIEIKSVSEEEMTELDNISAREIKAREEAIRILEQQCRELNTQLYNMEQQRRASIIEAERLSQEKIKAEAMERFLCSEIERVGY
jgi:hypothetical protein